MRKFYDDRGWKILLFLGWLLLSVGIIIPDRFVALIGLTFVAIVGFTGGKW